MVKSIASPLRRVVHLTHRLRMISRLRQLARQCRRIFERVVAGHRQPPVVPLVHPGDNTRTGRRTRGHGSIGVRQVGPLLGQFVEVGRLQHGVSGTAEAIAALLVGGDEQEICTGLWHAVGPVGFGVGDAPVGRAL